MAKIEKQRDNSAEFERDGKTLANISKRWK